MCIRDSVWVGDDVHDGRINRPHVWQHVAWLWRVDADNRRCLLYPSDAADGRSSGDLGGRRKIKKKKNNVNSKNAEQQSKQKLKQNEKTKHRPDKQDKNRE